MANIANESVIVIGTESLEREELEEGNFLKKIQWLLKKLAN